MDISVLNFRKGKSYQISFLFKGNGFFQIISNSADKISDGNCFRHDAMWFPKIYCMFRFIRRQLLSLRCSKTAVAIKAGFLIGKSGSRFPQERKQLQHSKPWWKYYSFHHVANRQQFKGNLLSESVLKPSD